MYKMFTQSWMNRQSLLVSFQKTHHSVMDAFRGCKYLKSQGVQDSDGFSKTRVITMKKVQTIEQLWRIIKV